jgi:hypothetical protein
MTATKLYSEKHNAKRAALKALGHTEFELVKTTDGQWYWIDLSEAAAEAAGAENDPTPTYTAPEPEVSDLDLFAVADQQEQTFSEPEPTANLTIDLGITPELAALIYGLGEAAGEAIPVAKKRRGLTAAAWEAAERGELPPVPDFPASNAYAAKHAAALQGLAKERNSEALELYQIGGTNTYSKALRDYRQALLTYLTNSASQMQEAA